MRDRLLVPTTSISFSLIWGGERTKSTSPVAPHQFKVPHIAKSCRDTRPRSDVACSDWLCGASRISEFG
ncbi:MAG: hypothetical protein SVY53_08995, partial [Chloroflexota bacterium]|nr:hypothetical protein [Chloroflexota bacterium]